MPKKISKNLFGNSSFSQKKGSKMNTSLLEQKFYIEIKREGDVEMKNQFSNRTLPWTVKKPDAVCKAYVDSGLIPAKETRSTAHLHFNDKNFDNVRFVEVNSMPAVGERLTAKNYDDQAISDSVDESPL